MLHIETATGRPWFVGRAWPEQDALTFYRSAGPARMTGGHAGGTLPIRRDDGGTEQRAVDEIVGALDGGRSLFASPAMRPLPREIVLAAVGDPLVIRFNGLYRGPAFASFLATLGDAGANVWLDLDDDWLARATDPCLLVPEPGSPLGQARLRLLEQDWAVVKDCASAVRGLVLSTPTLALAMTGYARRVVVAPNALAAQLVAPPPRPPGPLRIGAVVCSTHERDMPLCWAGMLDAARAAGGEVLLLGHPAARGRAAPVSSTVRGVRVHCYPALPFRAYLRLCATLDIAVAPLVDYAENRAKSACKWLEYSLGAVPGVYADLDPYAGVVRHGVTGLLARQAADYAEGLMTLVADASCRRRMGTAAQQAAYAGHGLAARTPLWRAATAVMKGAA